MKSGIFFSALFLALIYVNVLASRQGPFLIDHLVDRCDSSLARRLFIDAAFAVSESVRVTEIMVLGI